MHRLQRLDALRIIERVEYRYSIPPRSLLSSTRVQPVAEARQAAMALVTQYTGCNLESVAELFRRDRSTVHHALQQIEDPTAFAAAIGLPSKPQHDQPRST